MNHRESYTGKDSRYPECNAVGVPAEKFNSSADGSEDEDELESNDQGQAWCDSAALHSPSRDQRHDAEIHAHEDACAQGGVSERGIHKCERRRH